MEHLREIHICFASLSKVILTACFFNLEVRKKTKLHCEVTFEIRTQTVSLAFNCTELL